MPRKRIGLALSGGGARALAHVGVLKALLRAGIPVDCISGTSMGGVIAAAYALGYPIDVIEAKALQLGQMRQLIGLLDPSPSRRGLLEGSRVKAFLADLFLDRSFASTRIPLAIPAVDLLGAREVVFTSGMVFPAVQATIAIPGLFPPVEIQGQRLVDGGILNNLPVDCARSLGADVVIAVDAQFDPYRHKLWQDPDQPVHFPAPVPHFFLDFYRAELIMIAQITQAKLAETCPEVILRPPVALDITMLLGFPRVKEIIAAGEQAVEEAIDGIQQAVE